MWAVIFRRQKINRKKLSSLAKGILTEMLKYWQLFINFNCLLEFSDQARSKI